VPEALVRPSSGWPETSTSRRRRGPGGGHRRLRRIDELEANRRVYAENAPAARRAPSGLTRIVPRTAPFYLYVDVSDFASDSVAFTKEMLEEPALPPRRASTSMPSAAAATCASATRGRRRHGRGARRLQGWARSGGARELVAFCSTGSDFSLDRHRSFNICVRNFPTENLSSSDSLNHPTHRQCIFTRPK